MTVADVAERTSSVVGTDGDGGSPFDETAGWYSRLRVSSENIIIDTLNNNVREALRAYRQMYVSIFGGFPSPHGQDICLLFPPNPATLGPHSVGLQPQRVPISRQLQSSTHSSHF